MEDECFDFRFHSKILIHRPKLHIFCLWRIRFSTRYRMGWLYLHRRYARRFRCKILVSLEFQSQDLLFSDYLFAGSRSRYAHDFNFLHQRFLGSCSLRRIPAFSSLIFFDSIFWFQEGKLDSILLWNLPKGLALLNNMVFQLLLIFLFSV